MESRRELLGILMFIISLLRDSIKNLDESDNKMRIKLTNELKDYIKLYNLLFEGEIRSLNNREPF